ncbi:molybdate ABC transporter substrate-binding protein [Falsochrobactrum shanghaiense]|uniref:molybdate ABC transporter substrate-binding protein n=1 Tax=Falsochrobactrum shanghaiense TaxID=2201899 RepID=UPI001304DC1A|nr:substrate-binding domain-containing protein [Falsochrobactrum shanghaiense]
MVQTVRVMSTLAVELAMKRYILPAWTQAGNNAQMFWNPTGLLMEKVRLGARSDVLIAIDEPIEDLAESGIISRETICPIAQAGFGIAVRKGAPLPDLSSVEAFRTALLQARSVAYSLTGASGIHFLKVIEQLGISDHVKQRALAIPSGFTAEKLVSGQADLAVQQISELMSIEGVEIAGPFPEPLQKRTNFSAAIFTDAREPLAAQRFIELLSNGYSANAYERCGLLPLQSQIAA